MNEQHEMLKQLSALDFLLVDLQLFLDTHPGDRNALNLYNQVLAKADVMRNLYQQKYGPLTSFRSPSAYPWQWINCPWPWNQSFNYTLAGEELE